DLLHGLVAGQRAQRVDEVQVLQVVPQLAGGDAGNGVVDRDGAAQADHVLGGVVAGAAGPARVGVPFGLDLLGGLQRAHGGSPWAVSVGAMVLPRIRGERAGSGALSGVGEGGRVPAGAGLVRVGSGWRRNGGQSRRA